MPLSPASSKIRARIWKLHPLVERFCAFYGILKSKGYIEVSTIKIDFGGACYYAMRGKPTCQFNVWGALKIPHVVKSAPNIAEFKSERSEWAHGRGRSLLVIVIRTHQRCALLASLQCAQSSGGAKEMTVSGRFSAFQWTVRDRHPPFQMSRKSRPRTKMG